MIQLWSSYDPVVIQLYIRMTSVLSIIQIWSRYIRIWIWHVQFVYNWTRMYVNWILTGSIMIHLGLVVIQLLSTHTMDAVVIQL